MNQPRNHCQTILFAALLGLIATGCNKEISTMREPVTNAKSATDQSFNTGPLTLSEYKITRNTMGNLVIKGLVNNISSTKINHVEAVFKLIDKDGNEIGKTVASVDNLEAQFSWSFEATIDNESTVSAKFTGFIAK